MKIEDFAEAHSITPEALKSWINEIMHPTPTAKGELDVFSTNDFVELDIPK